MINPESFFFPPFFRTLLLISSDVLSMRITFILFFVLSRSMSDSDVQAPYAEELAFLGSRKKNARKQGFCYELKKHLTKRPFSVLHSLVEVALLIVAAILIEHIISNSVEVDSLRLDLDRLTFQMGNLSGYIIGVQSTFISLQASVYALQQELDGIENVTKHLQQIKQDIDTVAVQVSGAAAFIQNEANVVAKVSNETVADVRLWVDRYNLSNIVLRAEFLAFAEQISRRLSAVENRSTGFRLFEQSGSFLVPAGVFHVMVEIWGGGGGGLGDADPSKSAGGGGGGYGMDLVDVIPGTMYDVVVGQKGLPGQDGESSSFANITSTGGKCATKTSAGAGGGSNARFAIVGEHGKWMAPSGFEGGSSPRGGAGGFAQEGNNPGGGGGAGMPGISLAGGSGSVLIWYL